MKKLYFTFQLLFSLGIFYSNVIEAQNCSLLKATFQTYESRCAATGAIKISATGGSGSYQYKTIGPVNTNFTSTDSITGLSAGSYTVVVNDISTNCTFTESGIVVPGSYSAPGFTLTNVDVSCENGSNGSITAASLENGRSPFTFSIVAPSPMGVGTTNNTGIFNNLSAGDYSIRLTDSCGGIQTRTVTINNYTWQIKSDQFTKVSCNTVTGSLTVEDSKGNISTSGGIPGFSYGIIIQPGDTTWSQSPNFAFGVNAGTNSIIALARDSCGNIQEVTAQVSLTPSLNANVSISNTTCNSFTASVSGVTNFFSPSFCLYDSNNNQISCNSTGVFTGLTYGSYCIQAHDVCTDTTVSRCFSAAPPVVSVGSNVSISNKTCTSFNVAITGQSGLTNPTYCLLDSNNVSISCNTTGQFTNLPYEHYCITIKDGCIDTTITRCFSVGRPTPVINPVIVPNYITCTNFGIVVGGDSLTNPQYCLTDTNGVVIACNNTGVFDSVALGNYCVSVHDGCTDTTITRCFNVGPPVVVNDVTISETNQTCSTFTASAMSQNLQNPYFCLYNNSGVLIICDSSGVFNNLSYGSYCIKSQNSCPDTIFTNCFTFSPPVPSVSNFVNITNNACTTFSAAITGQQNLTNPTYCIINSSNDTLQCNNTGQFDSLAYGSYCITIANTCYDTTIKVCFSNSPTPLVLMVNAVKSCSYGYSKFNINVTGTLPVNLQIYNPGDTLILDRTYSVNNFSIDSIPDLDGGLNYTVIGTNNCGNTDTIHVAPVISIFTHIPSVIPLCPGSLWENGSGDIVTTAASNTGHLNVEIIQKGNTILNPKLLPDSAKGSTYVFDNLGPSTYIIKYRANDGCNENIYDTVNITPYQYPNLSKSSAYQCDNNGFSVSAVASYGVSPFTYSIIGSSPSTPSIIAGPQSSPVFNINNGSTYSLVRLRALDACGNAALADASILPLANDGITVSSNCFTNPSTLSVDTIYNSTYSWYIKTSDTASDSTLISTETSYSIPNLLPTDTGIYICHIIVNSGCINRIYYFDLNGNCSETLPVSLLAFSGKFVDDQVLLNWSISHGNNLNQIIIERENANGTFVEIGSINPQTDPGINQYQFLDNKPGYQNFYRIKLLNNDNTFTYSNIIFLQKQSNTGVNIYPNPATDLLNVVFTNANNHVYEVSLLNILNQKIAEFTLVNNGNQLQISKPKYLASGVYILWFIDTTTNEQFSQKVIFKPE